MVLFVLTMGMIISLFSLAFMDTNKVCALVGPMVILLLGILVVL